MNINEDGTYKDVEDRQHFKYTLDENSIKGCDVFLEEHGTLDVTPFDEYEDYSFNYWREDLDSGEKDYFNWSSTELYTDGGTNELQTLDEIIDELSELNLQHLKFTRVNLDDEDIKRIIDSLENLDF